MQHFEFGSLFSFEPIGDINDPNLAGEQIAQAGDTGAGEGHVSENPIIDSVMTRAVHN